MNEARPVDRSGVDRAGVDRADVDRLRQLESRQRVDGQTGPLVQDHLEGVEIDRLRDVVVHPGVQAALAVLR